MCVCVKTKVKEQNDNSDILIRCYFLYLEFFMMS